MDCKLRETIKSLRQFDLDSFVPDNIEKCKNCIYSTLCDRSLAN